MEAIACRTPVVSTKTGWPAEAVINGVNGVLTEVDDVNAIVSGMQWILSLSDKAWRDVSENAYRTVSSSSWDQLSKLFEAALKRVIGKGSAHNDT